MSNLYADTQTGETFLAVERKRAHYGFPKDESGGRFMVVGDSTLRLLTGSGYTAGAYRVLMHILLETDETCVIKQTQRELARTLGMGEATVYRAVSSLMDEGHLYRQGEILYLNPLVAFRGTGAEHQRAIARMPEHLRPGAEVRHLQPVS